MTASLTAFACDIFGGDPDPEALPLSVLKEMREEMRIAEEDGHRTRSEIARDAAGVGCVSCGDEVAPTVYGICRHCSTCVQAVGGYTCCAADAEEFS